MLKRVVIEAVNEHLRPIRRRRAELLAEPGYLDVVLTDGTITANAMANDTLHRVRTAMGMDYLGGPAAVR
jgi:tryptophanyl-tRNA synthetase